MTDEIEKRDEPKPHRTVTVVEHQQGVSDPEDAGEHEETSDAHGQSEEENDGKCSFVSTLIKTDFFEGVPLDTLVISEFMDITESRKLTRHIRE
jgi:hypothetical protein